MESPLPGEKNGERTGRMYYIVVRDAEETNLSVPSLSQLKKGPKYLSLNLIFLNFI